MATPAQLREQQMVVTMTQLAQSAETALNQNSDVNTTRARMKELYQQANEMAIRENEQAEPLLYDGSVLRAISLTYKLLSNADYRDSYKLQNSLSKVFRILVELKWQHSAKIDGGMPIPDDLKVNLIDITVQNIKYFEYHQDNCLPARLELRSARQAIRMFQTDNPLYQKYFKRLCDIVGSAQIGYPSGISINLSEVTRKILLLVKDLKRDDPTGRYSWYPFVDFMRRSALSIKSVNNYNTIIEPKQKICKKRGGNYSNCLAMVLIEIFKRSRAEEQNEQKVELRDLALRGIPGRSEGLLQLANWRRPSTYVDFIKHPIEHVTSAIFRAADRFMETRQLSRRFLRKIDRNVEFHGRYHAEIEQAFRSGQVQAVPPAVPVPLDNITPQVVNDLAAEHVEYVNEEVNFDDQARDRTLSPTELEQIRVKLDSKKADIESRAQPILDSLLYEIQLQETQELNNYLNGTGL